VSPEGSGVSESESEVGLPGAVVGARPLSQNGSARHRLAEGPRGAKDLADHGRMGGNFGPVPSSDPKPERESGMRRQLGWWLHQALVLPCTGAGQVIEGSVHSEEGSPAPGVLVLALDSLDSTRSSWITREGGEFRLTVPYPGTWTVRAERIGFGVLEQEVVVGEGGLAGIALEMVTVPVAIDGVQASVGMRCPGSSISPGVAELWREARSVLASVRRSGNTGASRFEVSFDRRDYRPGGFLPEFLQSESVDTVLTTGMVAMRSASPEFLAEQGFIVVMDDTASYYAPDADVLLSDEFLTGHCFSQKTRDDGGHLVDAVAPAHPPRGKVGRAAAGDLSGVDQRVGRGVDPGAAVWGPGRSRGSHGGKGQAAPDRPKAFEVNRGMR